MNGLEQTNLRRRGVRTQSLGVHSSARLATLALMPLIAVGCQRNAPPPESGASAAAALTEGSDALSNQIALGGKLYGEFCAGCHGDAGEGGDNAPPLVGQGALPLNARPEAKFRQVPFRTALDVGSWAMKTMPPKEPGSLTPAQYLAILAFALKANGVALDQPVSVESARNIVLHP